MSNKANDPGAIAEVLDQAQRWSDDTGLSVIVYWNPEIEDHEIAIKHPGLNLTGMTVVAEIPHPINRCDGGEPGA